MQPEESRALGMLLGGALGGSGTFLHEVHDAVASRPFRALGLLGAPVRAVHDRVARAAYWSVSRALGTGPRAGAAVATRLIPPQAPSLADSLRGSVALGAVNGAVGDTLARERSPLALPMSLRRRGRAVPLDWDGLADAYPDATPRLAVFIHGLCETDEAWGLPPFRGDMRERRTYGSRLREDLGYTPLYVRYNTGLHISDNGRRLSDLLEAAVEQWPAQVDEIALVGHSMGGLVARSACHYGHAANARWTRSVRHVFCLGSPHMGAPLEKAANVAGYALARLPETRPLAKLVNGRSVGIKDLRFGSCVEEDWCDCDADEFLRDRCGEVPFLACASYYFIGATLAASAEGPAASLVGDLLVQFPSAAGRGRSRRVPFEMDNGCHIGRASHFHLLNHPAVYQQLREWIERPRLTLPRATASA